MRIRPASRWFAMKFIKRAAAVAAMAASFNSAARADDSTRVIQYHAFSQPTIYCAEGLLCEITLGKDEKITNAWSSAPLWSPSAGSSGTTPVFTVKPEADNLRTNLILTTDRGRDYHLMLVSYDPKKQTQPLYTRFAYDDETWARIKAERRRHPVAEATSAPVPSISAQMDAACAKMPADEQYGTDEKPIALRPQGTPARAGRSVCHTLDATYVQMPLGGTEPNDLPVLVEDAADGVKIVNYTYDAPSRIFRVDDVATEYALVVGSGKSATHLRIQRQIRGTSTACPVKK